MDAPVYNVLNKMYKLMLFTQDAPDPVKIKSYKVTVDYRDINYGKRVEIPVIGLSERSVIMDAFIKVNSIFSDGGTFVPVFGVGYSSNTGSKLNNFRIIQPSDEILASTGVKSATGSAFGEDTGYTRLINYAEDDIVVMFYSPGVWGENADNVTTNWDISTECRAYHSMCGKVSISGGAPLAGVYAVGGYNFDGGGAIDRMAYTAPAWSDSGDPLPVTACAPKAVNASVSGSGESFVFGGSSDLFTGTMRSGLYFWDGVNHSASIASMNVARCALGGFCNKRSTTLFQIIAFGGRVSQTTNSVVATTEIYDGTDSAGAWSMGPPLLIPCANMGSANSSNYGVCVNGVDNSLNPINFSQEYFDLAWSVGQGVNAPSFWVSADGSQFSAIALTETTLEEYDGTSWTNGPAYPEGPARGVGICGSIEAALTLGGIDLSEEHLTTSTYETSRFYTHVDQTNDLSDLTNGSVTLFVTLTYK